MIRQAQPSDAKGMMKCIDSIGLFRPDELAEMAGMLASHFSDSADTDHFWMVDEDYEIIGVAYYAPERMTSGTWNLYFIGITPSRQRQGRGEALLQCVEKALAARGERLLLVETSALEDFCKSRSFYKKCGYEEEARIRDFYKDGDDKIVFRKLLHD